MRYLYIEYGRSMPIWVESNGQNEIEDKILIFITMKIRWIDYSVLVVFSNRSFLLVSESL